MTEILEKNIRGWFKECGEHPYRRTPGIHIYEAYERLSVELPDERLLGKEFSNKTLIRKIAENIFDVPFDCEKRGISNWGVHFRTNFSKGISLKRFKYLERYSEHLIEVYLPSIFPALTFWTGNRGHSELLPRQRKMYFKFLKEVYNSFVKNAQNP